MRGKVVCPGFVDVHTHYDAQLLWDPTASPSVLHGVTTVLGGNCGFSIAPLGPDDARYVQRMMAVVEGIPIDALESVGAVGLDVVRRLPGPPRPRHRRQRRLPGRALHHPARGHGGRRHPGAASPEQLRRHDRAGRAVAGRRRARVLVLARRRPRRRGRAVRFPPGRPTIAEFVALAGALRDHAGTTLEFIPTVGPIPDDRMELMADMSLAADRPLNWNLLGSLASEEIYEQQLEASDVAAGPGRACDRAGPARHDADARRQPLAGPAGLARRPGAR